MLTPTFVRHARLQPQLLGLRVLVVGAAATCAAIASELEEAGMTVREVVGAGRALYILEGRPALDVVVCTQSLDSPRLDGLDVLEAARREVPDARRVLVGSPVVEPLERIILQHGPVDAIAWMPLEPGRVTAAVRRVA